MRFPPVLRTMAVAPGTEWSTGWSSASIVPTAKAFPAQTALTGLGMHSTSTLGVPGKNAALLQRGYRPLADVDDVGAEADRRSISSAVSMTAFVVSEQNTGTRSSSIDTCWKWSMWA